MGVLLVGWISGRRSRPRFFHGIAKVFAAHGSWRPVKVAEKLPEGYAFSRGLGATPLCQESENIALPVLLSAFDPTGCASASKNAFHALPTS
jgi:hypothetical protein